MSQRLETPSQTKAQLSPHLALLTMNDQTDSPYFFLFSWHREGYLRVRSNKTKTNLYVNSGGGSLQDPQVQVRLPATIALKC